MVKIFGKAKADSKAGVWLVPGKPDHFHMNARRVDRHPEMKAYKAAIQRHSGKSPPPRKKQNKRDDYFARSAEFKVELDQLMEKIFAETLEDSSVEPVLLYNDAAHMHNRVVWRYCLYQGIIYEFDRADYSTDKMIEEIETLTQPRAESDSSQ